ncbi:InlB B-repeat-containing protein [Gardnerella vaginalis]|uniref:InlB B-repeat-containing protein n=1 Tax=Gardnerella vaginalis TaxID=2702 RepID=UPI0039EF2A13
MKLLAKKTMGLLLATLVAFGVVAGTTQAFAGGDAVASKQADKYTEIDMQEPYIKDAELHVYSVKDDNGSPAAAITITHKNSGGVDPQLTGVREYTAAAKESWVFKNWTYEQFLKDKDHGNYKGIFYSFSKDHNNKSIPYTSGNVISVNRTGTIGESTLIKRIYKVYANLNPTITATAGEGGSITPAGKTEVTYGENQKYNFTANEGYIIASLKIDGVEQTVEHTASGSYEFKAVKSPHTIEVSFVREYTITYTDGVDNEAIFTDQVYKAASGSNTPAFVGTAPSRKDYVFTGWTPTVADKVTRDVTYVAQWKDDKNNNGTPDDQEGHFTVTYTDGVDGAEIFHDQVHQNILVNMPTPAFVGTAPSRTDYVFTGWTPTVADKVTANVTYVAQWKRIQRTVTFKDGNKTHAKVKVETGKAINTDALTNEFMPKNPTKDGYTFKEWNTKENGKGKTFTGESVVNGDMTVYAIYTKDSAPAPKPTPTPTPAPAPKPTPTPKPQPEKRIGMIPKTGESASFAGLLAALGFSIAGLAILLKKKMTEENNK